MSHGHGHGGHHASGHGSHHAPADTHSHDHHSGEHDPGLLPEARELKPDRHPPRTAVFLGGPPSEHHHEEHGGNRWKTISYVCIGIAILSLMFSLVIWDRYQVMLHDGYRMCAPRTDIGPDGLMRPSASTAAAASTPENSPMNALANPRDAVPNDMARTSDEDKSTATPPAKEEAPAAETTPTPPGPRGPAYDVVSGDSLAKISGKQTPKRCGLKDLDAFVEAVKAANPAPASDGFQTVTDPAQIKVGKKIYLPSACTSTSTPAAP